MAAGQLTTQVVPYRKYPDAQLVQVIDELTHALQGEVQPTQIWLTASMNIEGAQLVTQLLLVFRKYVPTLQVRH